MQAVSWLKKGISYIWPVHLERRKTALNRMLDVDLYNGVVMLNTAQANYSFGRLHQVMTAALKTCAANGCNFNKVLVLGYGGGSAAQLIHQKHNPNAEITGVELDATVIDLAHKWFYTKNVTLFHLDAFDFIANSIEKYDLIICDLFFDIYTPDAAKTAEFYKLCGSLLNPQGVFLQNLMLKKESANAQFEIFNQIFNQSECQIMFGSNALLIGLK